MGDPSTASDRENVARYYDRLAANYGDGEFSGARRAAVLTAIADTIACPRRVLDLGCGNGAFAVEFAARIPDAHVVGMDLSPHMLRVATRRRIGHADFLRGDAGALPFGPGTFDLVFMSHVLMLVPNMERCVAGIAQCLVPGGYFVATIGIGAWRHLLGPLPQALLQIRSFFEPRTLRTFDDETRAGAACTAAGLQPEIRRAPFAVGWSALEEWIRIRWLTSLAAPLRRIAGLLLPAMRWRATGRTVELAETVLVATKR